MRTFSLFVRLWHLSAVHKCKQSSAALETARRHNISFAMTKPVLDPAILSEIIEMALSDHASFDQIKALHGLNQDEVKALMRQNLQSGSYRAWRRRVRQFSDRREFYK
jgi:uncharacterized protein (TIGR03643 family)